MSKPSSSSHPAAHRWGHFYFTVIQFIFLEERFLGLDFAFVVMERQKLNRKENNNTDIIFKDKGETV